MFNKYVKTGLNDYKCFSDRTTLRAVILNNYYVVSETKHIHTRYAYLVLTCVNYLQP